MPLNVIVTGAAGFIGSQLVGRLLESGARVTGIDNLCRGALENLKPALGNPNFQFVTANLAAAPECEHAFDVARDAGRIDTVWHMAANSDIGAGGEDASIDLRDTFLTSFYTLQAMRARKVPVLAFASSSAVYGVHEEPLSENSGPLFPISNYGAMKLASEGAITAAVENYLDRVHIFRFPNVIGAPATHGVIFDLLMKLRRSSGELEVLGNGRQQKPYLHVSELLDAMKSISERAEERINCFNIAPSDEGATVRYIAEQVVAVAAPGVSIRYTGGDKGWVGDVPRFSYCTKKLSHFGWIPGLSSLQAVDRAVREIHSQLSRCRQ
jgi:UDP-glucose 4-epimerase